MVHCGWSAGFCGETGSKPITQGLAISPTETNIPKIRYESGKSTLAGIRSVTEGKMDGGRFLGRGRRGWGHLSMSADMF